MLAKEQEGPAFCIQFGVGIYGILTAVDFFRCYRYLSPGNTILHREAQTLHYFIAVVDQLYVTAGRLSGDQL